MGERLVAAGKDGNLERLKCLLEAGADLSLSDNSGQTCLGSPSSSVGELLSNITSTAHQYNNTIVT